MLSFFLDFSSDFEFVPSTASTYLLETVFCLMGIILFTVYTQKYSLFSMFRAFYSYVHPDQSVQAV